MQLAALVVSFSLVYSSSIWIFCDFYDEADDDGDSNISVPFLEMCKTLLQITSERQALSDVPSTRLTQSQALENVSNSEVIDTQYAVIVCIVLLS